MAETLSQEEIDALREAVKTGEAFAGEEAPKANVEQVKVVAYDFRKPQILSAEQSHMLQMMHDTLGKTIQSNLASSLKAVIEIKLVAIDQISYGEFVLSLPNPTYLGLLASKPNIGSIALGVSTPIILSVLDILLGGVSGSSAPKARELTYLERKIFKGIADTIILDTNQAWANIADVSFEIAGEEMNPEYLQLATTETPCLCITFDVHIGSTSGLLNICYPFVVIQSAIARGESSAGKKRKPGIGGEAGDGEVMLKAIDTVPLDVSAVVGSSVISAKDLSFLKLGDVICLEQRIDNPVDVLVGRNRAFTAEIGKYQGKVAVGLVNTCGTQNANMNDEKKAG